MKLKAPGPSVHPAAKEYPKAGGQVWASEPLSKVTWEIIDLLLSETNDI